VHGSPSSQSVTDAQQPLSGAFEQFPAASQASAVQVLPSSQSEACEQQPATGSVMQTEMLVSQTERKHSEGLVHSALLMQQRAMGFDVHSCVARLHASDVHALPSLQSALAMQQPGAGTCAQAPALQVSVVQALPSLQSASVVQQPETTEWLHWPVPPHKSCVHGSSSLQSVADEQPTVAPDSYAPMSGAEPCGRATGWKHAATPPMLVMYA